MLLSAKTRKRILSFPFAREISNILVNISNSIFYKKINKSRNFTDKIRSLKNSKEGERCFIVGSGPSLDINQLNALINEDSFGANRIYKMFNNTLWRPNYYVIQDRYDETKGVYEKLDVEYFFVSDFYWKEHGMNNPKAICFHINRTLKQTHDLPFSEDVSKYVQAASTVTFSMIQFAAYMGYKEIFLVGMDHTYANVTNDKGVIIQRNNVKSHAFDDEKPNEVVANISYMEDAYRAARNYCESHGIGIYNATIGGALEIFERKDFWEVVKKKK